MQNKEEEPGIDLDKLGAEQRKFSKALDLKDSFRHDEIITVAGIETVSLGSRLIVGIVVLQEGEIIEQKFCTERAAFPYFSGFRAYRELPAIIKCFDELENKPDMVFIKGHGASHPRNFGIASHLSISINLPVIGVADDLMKDGGEVKGSDVIMNNKIVGKVIEVKEGARPIYVSPGNLISVETAAEFTKKFVKQPYKMPEPLRLARNLVKKVMRELH